MALVHRSACLRFWPDFFRIVSSSRSLCSLSVHKSVLTEAKENIFHIRINRPDQRNCVNRETANLLRDAFHEFDDRDDVAVAVLSGVGGTFCAGYDLSELSSETDIADHIQPAPMGPSHLLTRKPVIAAVDGFAVAGGLELALLCDMRVVEENAVLGVFCRRFGVPLIDGGTVRLPAIIGMGRALDMILTGRPVSGKEAFEIGLSNRLVAVGSALGIASSLAQSIAKFPPKCLAADRSSTYYSVFSSTSLDDALKFEFDNGKDVIEREGVDGAKKFLKGMGRHGKFNLNAWDESVRNRQPDSILLSDDADPCRDQK